MIISVLSMFPHLNNFRYSSPNLIKILNILLKEWEFSKFFQVIRILLKYWTSIKYLDEALHLIHKVLFQTKCEKVKKIKICKTGLINDPLGQTHSLTSTEHCYHFVFLKSLDGRTDGRHVRKQWSLPAVTVGWQSGSITTKSSASSCVFLIIPLGFVMVMDWAKNNLNKKWALVWRLLKNFLLNIEWIKSLRDKLIKTSGDGQTYGQYVRKQRSLPALTAGRPSGSIFCQQNITELKFLKVYIHIFEMIIQRWWYNDK